MKGIKGITDRNKDSWFLKKTPRLKGFPVSGSMLPGFIPSIPFISTKIVFGFRFSSITTR